MEKIRKQLPSCWGQNKQMTGTSGEKAKCYLVNQVEKSRFS